MDPIQRIFNALGVQSFETQEIDSNIVSKVVVPTQAAKNRILKDTQSNLRVITVMGSYSDDLSHLIEITGRTELEYLIQDNDVIFTRIGVVDESSKNKLIELLTIFNHSKKIDTKYWFLKTTFPLRKCGYVIEVVRKADFSIALIPIQRSIGQ